MLFVIKTTRVVKQTFGNQFVLHLILKEQILAWEID